MKATIRAAFPDAERAREAEHKLRFLRALDIRAGADSASWSAEISEELTERVVRLVQQVGGTVER